jgi:hypothetical protein
MSIFQPDPMLARTALEADSNANGKGTLSGHTSNPVNGSEAKMPVRSATKTGGKKFDSPFSRAFPPVTKDVPPEVREALEANPMRRLTLRKKASRAKKS